MAKKDKDAAASAKKEAKTKEPKKKEVKVKAPPDPVKTGNLIRLLNLLALILAVAAFLLQLFAVISHHWKWQSTDLRSLMSSHLYSAPANVHRDSQLEQNYGLFSREVKLFANNDEQIHTWGSTRFPRMDDGDDQLHQCLSGTSSVRSLFLQCSSRIAAPEYCHCRRYVYWNVVIAFEIIALIFLGLVVILAALLTTHLQDVLKLAAAGLAILAFIFLLIGLILILSHLKRETRSLADAYPHVYQRLSSFLGLQNNQPSGRNRRGEIYRAYSLLPGQYPHNETHFTEYSEAVRAWVYKSYATSGTYIPFTNVAPKGQGPVVSPAGVIQTGANPLAPASALHGPAIGYDQVFDNTRACIGWSTVLSIIAMALALLVGLLLLLSMLKAKSIAPKKPNVKTDTTTNYELVSQEVPSDVIVVKNTPGEVSVVKTIPAGYDPTRPIGDAIVTAKNIGQGTSVEITKPYINISGQPGVQVVQPDNTVIRNVIIPVEEKATNIVKESLQPVVTEIISTVPQS